MGISMEKVQEKAPELVSTVKAATVSLDKRGLGEHVARVALIMDTSGSMDHLYRNGTVQAIANRALALGLRFDDNGAVDVFGFDSWAREMGEMDLDNFKHVFLNPQYGGGTSYSAAIDIVRRYYAKSMSKVPVYAMFVTDGDAQDPNEAKRSIKDAASEPIFWQFMGVGRENFRLLKSLDNLKGRVVDNANFFDAGDGSMSDDEFYKKMMDEYPSWVKEARQKGIIE